MNNKLRQVDRLPYVIINMLLLAAPVASLIWRPGLIFSILLFITCAHCVVNVYFKTMDDMQIKRGRITNASLLTESLHSVLFLVALLIIMIGFGDSAIMESMANNLSKNKLHMVGMPAKGREFMTWVTMIYLTCSGFLVLRMVDVAPKIPAT